MSIPDRARIKELKDREDARFLAEHPRSAALLQRGRASMPNGVPMAWLVGSYHHLPPWVVEGRGARFTDVDGHEYSDFNIADLSMFCGYAPEPLVRAVADRMARGNQFLLPTEDAIVVSEELARRYGIPKWQYTLSATHANTEAIRVARVATGRDKVLLFDGKYHGHFDAALVELAADGTLVPEEAGLPADVVRGTVLVPFNDVEALARALERRDVALVLTEPALTNNHGLILPDPGFHDAAPADHAGDGHAPRLRRDAHPGRRRRGPDGRLGPRARPRHDRQVDRRRDPVRRVGHDRGDRRPAPPGEGPRRRARAPGRHGRDALRQRPLDGGGAGDDAGDPHARRRTPTRSAWVRGWRAACGPPSIEPGSRGTSTTSGRGRGTRSARRRCGTPPRRATAPMSSWSA